MIVFSDTSPLQYLILIEHAYILPLLYGRVIVPPAVLAELAHEQTPESVRGWLSNRPDWLQVQGPKTMATVSELALGAGECAAIALAEELSADALLIDDRERFEARRRRLPILGTSRVLADAANQGLVDIRSVFERLALTNFRTDEQLVQRLLALDAERRNE